MARLKVEAAIRLGLSATPVIDAPEAATQTFKKGAPLVFSAGYVQEAGANPRSIFGIAQDAGQNGTAAGDKTARVAPVNPSIVYEITLDKASDLGNRTLAQTDLGAEYGITKDSDGVWYLDVDKTTGGTNTVAVIVGFKDAVATAQARVYIVFLQEVNFFQSA